MDQMRPTALKCSSISVIDIDERHRMQGKHWIRFCAVCAVYAWSLGLEVIVQA